MSCAGYVIDYQEHIAAVEQAIRDKGKLDHTAMQGVFLGPARSGKSSLMKRLLKEEIDHTSPSTGAVDKVVQVHIKRYESFAAGILDSSWLRLTYGSEAVRLMMLAAKMHRNQPGSSSGSRQLSPHDAYHHPSINLEMPAGYVDPKQTFEQALREKGVVAIQEHLDGSWTLYLSDTGGQMEFQEILPLLVSGPSLFFIVFPLNRDLNDLFTIEYQLPSGERSESYQSTLTLKEAILQSLSTIAAMGTFTYKGIGVEEVELKPKAILVGTHKDQVDADPAKAQVKIEEIDDDLQQSVMSMAYYRDNLVEFANENQLIFTVNNRAEDDSDFVPIRSKVSDIAKLSEYQMRIPKHWLIFSIVLRRLDSPVIGFDECLKVAQQCGIDSDKELRDVLWFLHTKMGVIRYFPHGDLGNIVIIDPQILFNKVTELIVNTFTFANVRKYMSQQFKQRGIFSFDDYKRFSGALDPNLTPSRFIDLLKQLRIVVPFLDVTDRKDKLLIPCVWKHADEACDPPKQHHAVPTLAITFDCGYCPNGVAGAVVKYLMTNEMKSKFPWKLQPGQIFRDQIMFSVGPHYITLCLYATHFEIVFAPCTSKAEAVCNIQDVCREVCQSIKKAIHEVSKDANLTCQCEPSFYCTLCKSHIAELVQHNGIPCQLKCPKCPQPALSDLPSGFHYWIDGSIKEEAKTAEQSVITLTLPSACKLVFSLRAQWKNLGLFLNVDDGTLDAIEIDNKKVDDCLREMLKVWLKKVNPPPSWQMLADNVKLLDETIAKKIHDMYC